MEKYISFVLDVKSLNRGIIRTTDGKLIKDTEKVYENNIYSNLEKRNAIYIYRNSKNKKVYIGQTGNLLKRNKEHYSGNEKRFNTENFNELLVVFSEYFHRSALDDVEKQLITYFVSENKDIGYDSNIVTNSTNGNNVNDYRDRDEVSTKVLLPLWEKTLFKDLKWVTTEKLIDLRTNALVTYSPIKEISPQQSEIIREILNNPQKDYVINGDAGTGKTVLLTHLIANLVENTDKRIGVVVQKNWLRTCERIFSVFGLSSDNLVIKTSTSLINLYEKSSEKFDIIIVDEAHKLSQRRSKQHNSFNAVYKNEFANYQSHLEILKDIGSQIVLMYDVLQEIRPANISRDNFRNLTSSFEKKYLSTQFRIVAPEGKSYNSDDYINGIKYLLYKDTGLLEYTSFNPNFNRDVFCDKDSDSYFGYFTSEPLKNLTQWIEDDQKYNPEHVDRVLAGLVEKWKQADGEKAEIKQWVEGDLQRRWNSTAEDWLNCNDEDAKEQIGSVFAVQGVDLNKVGVLIGNDLQIDDDGHLYAEPKNFHNENGRFTREEEKLPENRKEFTLLVLNIYYVLLTRGIDGIRLGFWHNDSFRKYMEDVLDIK